MNIYKFVNIIMLICICSLLNGCDVIYRSRIRVVVEDQNTGTSIISANAKDEVDAIIRSYFLEKGYSIKISDENDPWVKQEIGGEDANMVWVAHKQYEPSIIFTKSKFELIVILVQLSGPLRPEVHRKYTNELYKLLEVKFGTEHLFLKE